MLDLYRRTVTRFPIGNVSYMFAYGSAVKQQVGYDGNKGKQNNVIDLMFCVRDSFGFHAENIHRHASHYSAMRYMGPNLLARYQDKLAARVYFNTLVPLQDLGITIKYGVVHEENLVDDLINWRHLYLAGRLQKPVTGLVDLSDNPRLQSALDQNLLSACRTALLMLPEKFSVYELFCVIAGISYKGDFRMIFGENKLKVHNIVSAQLTDFYELYQPIMGKLMKYMAVNTHGEEPGSQKPVITFEQDKSTAATRYHLLRLPKNLRRRLQKNTASTGDYFDVVEHLCMTPLMPKILQVSVNDIVWRSSIAQSVKNIPTAGIIKSLQYSYRKAKKTFA
ncbi:hypothetical protein KR093_009574 [Drosophila rubida]|uniref:Phosphatidate cytidylyltransferase, mitochondrial n=1 Tax=Drosophila rubida TaxID=30044 RepID=A0AAD4JUQ5_9MUSC|nr:hypothetical protein KR093_009574 [Drosophila rubida]